MYKGIRFKGYKAFAADTYTELDNLPRVSVIIGKNNSGKSSVIDVMGMMYDRMYAMREEITSCAEEIAAEIPITRDMCDRLLSGYTSIQGYTSGTLWIKSKGRSIGYRVEPEDSGGHIVEWNDRLPLWNSSDANRVESDISRERDTYVFRHVAAERNIVPEEEEKIGGTLEDLSSTGRGASNIIRAFLNDSSYDETIIEDTLLKAVNEIMSPEAVFEGIRVQQVQDGYGNVRWEVFLKEEGMSRCPLSRMGSGLKTIILVLLNLLVIPELDEYKNKKMVYGFEELENNLHPAMQRKLFEYIYEFAEMHDVQVFITTHSHVAINAFYDKDDAGIFHVYKQDGRAFVKRIESYLDKTRILDDLDVKASDLLQSNGIIWVEGPSDRVYIKHWLDLYFPDRFVEGVHYQFLYYGGRLLSQYSAEEVTELISVIKTNRNAVIVMDSDKRNRNARLNDTKKRIIAEFDALGMMSWVTKGKEIENYIPKTAIEEALEVSLKAQCGQYELFPGYIEKYYRGFTGKKVRFARCVVDHMTEENMAGMMDVKKRVTELGGRIAEWNGGQSH
ncbi:AAA family ATPase [Coprococcus eutactus]|jgi:hypothetical protein|uniref:ATP-dependent nuclease n=1 Tax=Coprococcus eutactus TaxID=33043 RepID=UPI001C02E867|nr:AAA family ATPase [Coprococcus eutactus]MBT9732209.1 AAA family ATPase [Coprococcus eutactus]